MTMSLEHILLICNGLLLTVAGYFIKATMERLSKAEQQCITNIKDIELLKQEHILKFTYFTEKMDDFKVSVDALTREIKELNHKIKV